MSHSGGKKEASTFLCQIMGLHTFYLYNPTIFLVLEVILSRNKIAIYFIMCII